MCFRPPTVEMKDNVCPNCGAQAMLGARKCSKCGADLSQKVAATGTPAAHGAPGAPAVPTPIAAPSAPSVSQKLQ